MTYLFISDLHLSPDHPRLVRGFLALLKEYQTKNTQLYILGDWFNAWIGDDYTAPWLDEIINALQKFSSAGNQVYFQVGNRDFALGQKFLDQFDGILLPDVYNLEINHMKIRLEHGDALCTDDIAYQRFRKVIRNPVLLGLIKRTPLSFRQKLANGFRKKSSETKQLKSYDIMDVNAQAVQSAIEQVDYLIHGHTHRPEIHQIQNKQRIVLGDWRTDSAWILELNEQKNYKIDFKKWSY
ncbi:UDP-2,3-diacylglucosamine diphosphatase [Acinetobacter haemolyticus]|uniref:UDP-2,3-diacylglucosamine hydrolase n=2 Tax=Acinetobacter haemolyticus TaxID=29430 RepID=A0A372MQD8_ACIHA|nr:UDP-2,3-diacylglucosamine diphosphatase [Acinetobacter haemolyticus]ENW17743.1 UDP-2,3-diacylglucosamine hydrolase [Acinetobacter haemolyticus CIP 64.3 = MTCC 9819]ENW18865.1 UDP-2,3-diacylglucosamine hydrolase [Acinetobacter haemolyticus NIPH 261]EPR90123.1 UDP-2,3-diacylglucosamine hydrolase [Acinetobacter haemolyticus CIP 64.3 = MTCC 9819]MQZ32617.1 UDP-2,3-diacylglucosamine diphosphatase [Acinetobacter haemolyticus]NAR50301.1 UDP-2,3-diacylglucosamine diphosphatase [Acinetobacter haemol